jgi:hypothetical protein
MSDSIRIVVKISIIELVLKILSRLTLMLLTMKVQVRLSKNGGKYEKSRFVSPISKPGKL